MHETRKAKASNIGRKLRLIGGFVDQAIMSLGSITYLVCAAQFLSPAELGGFALGLATLALALSVVRAICGEALLVRVAETRDFEAQAGAMLGLVALLALLACCLCLVVALTWRSASAVFVATAFAVPGVLLQDAVRYLLIARRDARALIVSDLVWVGASSATILASASNWQSAGAVLAAWSCAMLTMSVGLLLTFRWSPEVRSALGWLRASRHQSAAFAVESIVGAVVGYATTVVIAATASEADVAAYRATVSVFGITSLAINFLKSSVLSELAHGGIADGKHAALVMRNMAIVLALAVGAATAMLRPMPEAAGQLLLGETWTLVSGLLVAGAVNRLAASASVVPAVMLRVLGVSWQAAKVRIMVGALGLALGPVGAYFGGASGALYADSLSYVVAALLLSLLVKRTLRKGTAAPVQDDARRLGWMRA